jgi:hypothetical protein
LSLFASSVVANQHRQWPCEQGNDGIAARAFQFARVESNLSIRLIKDCQPRLSESWLYLQWHARKCQSNLIAPKENKYFRPIHRLSTCSVSTNECAINSLNDDYLGSRSTILVQSHRMHSHFTSLPRLPTVVISRNPRPEQ